MTDDTPDGLWVFDGVCNLCSASVRLVLALDHARVIRLVPMQSAYGQILMQTAGLDPGDPASFIFFDRGAPLTRSAAIVALAARLPWPW